MTSFDRLSAVGLIHLLGRQGIRVDVRGERVVLNGPRAVVDQVADVVRALKPALLAVLRERGDRCVA